MKLIFSDLDGTLLTTNKQILSENILTLKKWIEADIGMKKIAFLGR